MAELQKFLSDLKHGLVREMSPRETDAVLLETEAHLRERMEALVELGLPQEAAELEAIAAFGEAKSYVQETIDAHRPSRKALEATIVKLAAMASVVALVVPFIAIWTLQPYYFILCFPLLLAVAAASFRARRVLWAKLFGVSVAFLCAFWLCATFAFYSLDAYGGSGLFSKWDTARVQKSLQANADGIKVGRDITEKWKVLRESQDPMTDAKRLGLEKGGLIAAPVAYNFFPSMVSFRYLNLTDALSFWKSNARQFASNLSQEGTRSLQSLEAIKQAERANFMQNFLANWPEARPVGGIWLCLLLGANLLGGGAGWLWRRLRGLRITVQIVRD